MKREHARGNNCCFLRPDPSWVRDVCSPVQRARFQPFCSRRSSARFSNSSSIRSNHDSHEPLPPCCPASWLFLPCCSLSDHPWSGQTGQKLPLRRRKTTNHETNKTKISVATAIPSWFQHVTGSLFLHQDLVFLHHQVWLDALQQCSTRVVVFPCVDAFLLFWVDVVLLTTLEGFVLLLCACVATTACEAPPKTSAVLSPPSTAVSYHQVSVPVGLSENECRFRAVCRRRMPPSERVPQRVFPVLPACVWLFRLFSRPTDRSIDRSHLASRQEKILASAGYDSSSYEQAVFVPTPADRGVMAL